MELAFKDSLEQQIFSPGIRIIDDPHRPRGLRSKPFDAEGLNTCKTRIVEDGRINAWFLDLATARQLDSTSTGHAARSRPVTPAQRQAICIWKQGR